MDLATNRADLLRAVLEGIAMLTAELVTAANQSLGLASSISIDGGLSQNTYFAQFLASACQKTIKVPAMFELSALGLAGMCGVDISNLRGATATFEPNNSLSALDREKFLDALARTRGWRQTLTDS